MAQGDKIIVGGVNSSGLLLSEAEISNNSLNVTDQTFDIFFGGGVVADNATRIVWIHDQKIKQIDAVATSGTNQGGFPSGITIQVATWYHCFVIAKPDGTNECGFDTDLNAVNLIDDHTGSGGSDYSGFTMYRRVGSVFYTDGVNGILRFEQDGDIFTYQEPISDVTLASPPSAWSPYTLSCPTGLYVTPLATMRFSNGGTGNLEYFGIVLGDLYDYSDIVTVDVSNMNVFFRRTDQDPSGQGCYMPHIKTFQGQIRAMFSSGATCAWNVVTHGWIDGRDK